MTGDRRQVTGLSCRGWSCACPKRENDVFNLFRGDIEIMAKLFSKVFFELKETFLDLIFPSDIYCISCQKPIFNESYSLCKSCRQKISWIDDRTCSQCGKALQSWYFPNKCSDCIQEEHYFMKGFSCVEYGELESKLIIDFKYYGKSYYGKNIAEMMYDKLKNLHIWGDYIIPVPLHPLREKERGYNQSHLVAEYLSHLTGIPLKTDVLKRVEYTRPQNKLSLKDRKKNLENAFKASPNGVLIDKDILLVDDVYTTGNTVDECSKVLIGQGVQNIYIITYAIGKNE